MSERVAALLTSITEIQDGELYRQDWNGLPRFYWVRIYPHEPLRFRSWIEHVQERVKVYVQLNGDPSAWSERICEENGDEIREAMIDCVGDIEDLCRSKWERECQTLANFYREET